MKILIDTNVLMDYLAKRPQFFEAAQKIVSACMARKFEGYIAAHSVLNLFYILRRDYTAAQRRAMLMDLCFLFHVVGVGRVQLLAALADDSFSDFEDCVQTQCAAACQADYIVTRNPKDFVASEIPVILPDVFCQSFIDG